MVNLYIQYFFLIIIKGKMKKIFMTFSFAVVLIFSLSGAVSGVCCPPPNCLDGTTSFWSCGAGPGKPFWPGGCFFLTACGCKKCRVAKNIDQCFLYCKHVEVSCESICYGEPWAEDICVSKCMSEQDVCNDWCENIFS
jgi:hypothetical protein